MIVITVAYGGTFLLRVVSGRFPANELQQAYFRAGHAHAGVLIILGLVVRLFMESAPVPEWSRTLADFVLYAAVLMSAGFFLSAVGRDPQRPNRFRALIWIGALCLLTGLGGAGIGLIIAGTSA